MKRPGDDDLDDNFGFRYAKYNPLNDGFDIFRITDDARAPEFLGSVSDAPMDVEMNPYQKIIDDQLTRWGLNGATNYGGAAVPPHSSYAWSDKEREREKKWDLDRTRLRKQPKTYDNIYSTMPALPPRKKSTVNDVTGAVTSYADFGYKGKSRSARAKKRYSKKSRMPRRRYYGKRRRYSRYGRRRYGRRYYGRGDYRMDPGASFGTRWGGYLGSKIGEFGGGWAQRALGLGDYTVKTNVFQGRLPEVTNLSGNGGTIIRFQEYLGDIITSATPGAFKIETFMLNAANERTFPWLSQIAANYDQYEIQGILFNFRSTSGNALNSTNTALGTVMFATQYDTVDPPFTSKTEMLNYEFSTSSVPSQDQTHMIECDPHQTPLPLLFTEDSETNPPNTDPRLYFLGRTAIATTGFQGASVNIGELHITYQVKLLKPKLTVSLGLTNQFMRANFPSNPGFSTAQPLGPCIDPLVYGAGSNMVLTYSDPFLGFPESNIPKKYFLEVFWVGTVAAACVLPSLTGSTGVTYSSLNQIAANTTRMICSLIVTIAAGSLSPRITFGLAGVFPTGTLSGNITCSEIPSS